MHRRNLLAAPVLLPGLARAQMPWPTRPIRMVCGFPPAGTTDIAARLIAERLAVRLGQPVAVENRAGATGNIAAELVARAEPDATPCTPPMSAPPASTTRCSARACR